MADVGGVAGEHLRGLVERIEQLEEEKRILASDIRDLYAEAKSGGYDTKALRALIAERKKDPDEVAELQAHLDLYRRALGEFVSTPLGQSAIERVAA